MITRYTWSFQKTVFRCEHKVPERNCTLSLNLLQGWRTDENFKERLECCRSMPNYTLSWAVFSFLIIPFHLCVWSHIIVTIKRNLLKMCQLSRPLAFTNQKLTRTMIRWSLRLGQRSPFAVTQLWCSHQCIWKEPCFMAFFALLL